MAYEQNLIERPRGDGLSTFRRKKLIKTQNVAQAGAAFLVTKLRRRVASVSVDKLPVYCSPATCLVAKVVLWRDHGDAVPAVVFTQKVMDFPLLFIEAEPNSK